MSNFYSNTVQKKLGVHSLSNKNKYGSENGNLYCVIKESIADRYKNNPFFKENKASENAQLVNDRLTKCVANENQLANNKTFVNESWDRVVKKVSLDDLYQGNPYYKSKTH